MQQHYQVINLHNIIRSQQSKIQQLREQLRIATQRQQIRYGQFLQNNKNILQQKNKMIQFLKTQLDKAQKYSMINISQQKQKNNKDVQKLQKQLIAQKRKCIQLQAKLKRQQYQHQTQIKSLTQISRNQAQQLQKIQQAKAILTIQITKLNHYYKNSLFQIGKRKETLLWVDKFTEYLENMDVKEKRTLDDISSFVKNQVNGLKNVLADLVVEIAKNQSQVYGNKNLIYSQINKNLTKALQQSSQILKQNQQFWQSTLKTTLKSTQNQQLKSLQSQLQSQQHSYTAQIQQLKSQIKSLQSQKKVIILGFQQLRTLSQQKQQNYREQIKFLKKNIQELIETGTQRDREFQEQIQVLVKQIQNLSERYYENIQTPVRKTSAKISEDMQQVKIQLNRIQSNSSLKTSVQNIQKLVAKHSQKYLNNKQLPTPYNKYFQQQSKIISQILQLINSNTNPDHSQISRQKQKQKSMNKSYTSRSNTFDKQFQQMIEEQRVILRQKFNKSQYQVVLAKKHLAKLKEYCQNLQKKSTTPSLLDKKQKDKKDKKQTNTSSSSSAAQKIIQLQAQNQALKQDIELLKKQHKQQLQFIHKKSSIKSHSQQYKFNSNQMIKNCVNRILDLHKKIQVHLQNQNQNILEMKENTKVLKNTLFKPLESIQQLAKQVLQISVSNNNNNYNNNNNNGQDSSRNSFTDRQQINTQRTHRSIFSVSDQIQVYKDLLIKKNQNSQTTSKMITDLIKTLRQNSTKQQKDKPSTITSTHKKQQQLPSSTSNSTQQKRQNLYKNLQKRLKQSQTLRIKDRQQFIQKLSKLQQSMQKISQKINKSLTLKSTLHKFQTNLDSKINQIISRTQIKLDKSDILMLKDDVIADLRSKLNQANHQSQGLRKEMSILYSEKKL